MFKGERSFGYPECHGKGISGSIGPKDTVRIQLAMELSEDSVLLDPGCGAGRPLLTASFIFGTKQCIGWEWNEHAYQVANNFCTGIASWALSGAYQDAGFLYTKDSNIAIQLGDVSTKDVLDRILVG